MRMWGVDPKALCRKHLLGEHVEMHMMAGTLLKGRGVSGYLDGLFDPWRIEVRHDALVLEMGARGYNHRSPIQDLNGTRIPKGWVDPEANLQELARRCPECRKRITRCLITEEGR